MQPTPCRARLISTLGGFAQGDKIVTQQWYHKALPLSSQIALGLAPDPRQVVLAKAFEFKRAVLAYASHRSSCRGGCDDDDCTIGGELWMIEFKAQSDLFDALSAAQHNVEPTGATSAAPKPE